MNQVVARLLTDLTASMRFSGDLNVDLNEITTNLVPYPRLHYLLSSLSTAPMDMDVSEGYTNLSRIGVHEARPRRMTQMFAEAFSTSRQLMRTDPRFVTVPWFTEPSKGIRVSFVNGEDSVTRLTHSARETYRTKET